MLSPWDEIPYFDTTLFTAVALTQNKATRMLAFNPMRVGLIISTVGGTNIILGPDNTVAAGKGIVLTSTLSYLALVQRDWGVLVQQEWWAFTVATGVTGTVVEVLLKEWPRAARGADEPS